MEKMCSYPGCENKVHIDEHLCEYHRPINQKPNKPAIYNEDIKARINKGQRSFKGYIIPGPQDFTGLVIRKDISFEDVEFHGDVDFTKTTFSGNTNFEKAKFLGGANFSNTSFKKWVSFGDAAFNGSAQYGHLNQLFSACFVGCQFEDVVEFAYTQFTGGDVIFSSAKFYGDRTDFKSCLFEKGYVDFSLCKFSGIELSFLGSKFHGGYVIFDYAEFKNRTTLFDSTEFYGGEVVFRQCFIDQRFVFSKIDTSYGILFYEVIFGESSTFSFKEPLYTKPRINPILVFFYKVRFVPFKAFFENIDPECDYTRLSKTPLPLFAFRLCALKDVYFSNCNMSLFSFYHSAFFEESIIVSSKWPGVIELSTAPILTEDRIRICEEIYTERQYAFLKDEEYDELTKRIQFPESFLEIAELYLRFKSSADKSKDYHLASHFYQNEFELKRKYWNNLRKNLGKIKFEKPRPKSFKKKYYRQRMKISLLSKSILYRLYKFISGYGEKPLVSTVWFMFFILLFSIFHMFNGIKTPTRIINDSLVWDSSRFCDTIGDFFYSILFTLCRIIPINLIPYLRDNFEPVTLKPWDIFLSFSNTIVLSIMVLLIGIGLKRHFRRF